MQSWRCNYALMSREGMLMSSLLRGGGCSLHGPASHSPMKKASRFGGSAALCIIALILHGHVYRQQPHGACNHHVAPVVFQCSADRPAWASADVAIEATGVVAHILPQSSASANRNAGQSYTQQSSASSPDVCSGLSCQFSNCKAAVRQACALPQCLLNHTCESQKTLSMALPPWWAGTTTRLCAPVQAVAVHHVAGTRARGCSLMVSALQQRTQHMHLCGRLCPVPRCVFTRPRSPLALDSVLAKAGTTRSFTVRPNAAPPALMPVSVLDRRRAPERTPLVRSALSAPTSAMQSLSSSPLSRIAAAVSGSSFSSSCRPGRMQSQHRQPPVAGKLLLPTSHSAEAAPPARTRLGVRVRLGCLSPQASRLHLKHTLHAPGRAPHVPHGWDGSNDEGCCCAAHQHHPHRRQQSRQAGRSNSCRCGCCCCCCCCHNP